MTNEKLKLSLERKRIRDAHLTEEQRIQVRDDRIKKLIKADFEMAVLVSLTYKLIQDGVIK